jgi:transposase
MKVMIGVDPHKGSHTATMLDRREQEVRRIKVRAGGRQVPELLAWADGVRPRTWAIESAGGMGYLLAQQLVAAGETVVNVPATLASRVRVLASGQSTKSDPNDARSIAGAALRAPSLAPVRASDHTTVCRLLVKHHNDLARWRNKLCCRLHALVGELVPGGISREVVVNQARSLLEGVEPDDVASVERHRQAVELVAEIDRLDAQLRDSKAPITTAVTASGTTLTEIFGIGPIVAGMLIGYTSDPIRDRGAVRLLQRDSADRVLLRRPRHPPTVTARQPATQPRPAHRRDHPDPSPAQSRPRLLRPQARRRQDATRGDPGVEATAQRRRVAPPHRRRPPSHQLSSGPGQDTPGTARSPAWPPHT